MVTYKIEGFSVPRKQMEEIDIPTIKSFDF